MAQKSRIDGGNQEEYNKLLNAFDARNKPKRKSMTHLIKKGGK